MKRLKIKTITCQFAVKGLIDSDVSRMDLFDERVNEFLATIEPENIFQITYLNSTAGMGERANPRSILVAAITYFVGIE